MDKEYIKDIIVRLQAERINNNISPDYVPIVDIQNMVNNELMHTLRLMCKSGELDYHRTINGISVGIER